MTKQTIEARLAQLNAQRAALKARLSQQDRANDTRRKVLLGTFILHQLNAPDFDRADIDKTDDADFTRRLGDWLRRELPGFLTRDADKVLFADLLGANAVSTVNDSAAAAS
ncbi:mobilization protein [Chelatococcus asaccharovorans]|uniref:mobilization protein n=1 Tax=Chelatococcus asaccharovorans TaxID=28210 RepID=UPI00224C7057|nr:mobilization protein [Chelatococcus asaccharovorans]CAH1658401.1 Mobilization protein [Chelatococcus asaccharovorans]CAH1688667.1 Mobilization protein [Chelatococcus asaccharovorans]